MTASRTARDMDSPDRGEYRSLAPADFTGYIEDVRSLVLEEINRQIPSSPKAGRLYQLMLEYPLRHGKSLRPALCIAACRAFGGSLTDVIRTAAVLELYHNAFLIHDDVEDGSTHRRGEETLHQKYGIPIAVNVGDGILAMALQPLLDNTESIGLGRALRNLETIATMSRESAEGQMLELDWMQAESMPVPRDYLRIVYKKTCWYSFVAPLETGAVSAGLDAAEVSRLRKFAIVLGIAFQIIDDALNLDESAESYGKELGGDLWEGKRTLMLIHAVEQANPADKARAMEILGKGQPTRNKRDHLQSILRAQGLSPEQTELICSEFYDNRRIRNEEDVSFLKELILKHDGLGYAKSEAERYSRAAEKRFSKLLTIMPDSVHRDFLASVVEYVIYRKQ